MPQARPLYPLCVVCEGECPRGGTRVYILDGVCHATCYSMHREELDRLNKVLRAFRSGVQKIKERAQ